MTGAPFDLIVGSTAMEALRSEIGLRHEMVTLTIGHCSIRASLPLRKEGIDEMTDDSAELTTEEDEDDGEYIGEWFRVGDRCGLGPERTHPVCRVPVMERMGIYNSLSRMRSNLIVYCK